MSIVTFENVTRVYQSGDHELNALEGVNLSLDDVVIRVKNGKIQSCEEQTAPMGAEEVEW